VRCRRPAISTSRNPIRSRSYRSCCTMIGSKAQASPTHSRLRWRVMGKHERIDVAIVAQKELRLTSQYRSRRFRREVPPWRALGGA
jgi:hypothetical protein